MPLRVTELSDATDETDPTMVSDAPLGPRPARTDLSDRLSKDLGKRGFKFVGSTIVYAYMQGIGMVDDHDRDCICRTRR